jgi:vacuolar-type H+-ATPase subunit B/Vma2
MTHEDDLKLLEKLNSNSALKKRVEEILNIAHNSSGKLITADEAEEKTIEEVRKLGREVLREWAVNQHEQAMKTTKEENPKAKKHIKKNSIGNQHLDE